MKQIVVISGKGGTGKTLITASFACLANNKVMVDCDVDAPNLHLLLNPEIKQKHEFLSGATAKIDKNTCQECGQCISVCRFDAINENFMVDPISCEGCAVCSHICPAGAIVMEENISGHYYISETKYGPFVHAKLNPAEENSGKLVTKIREIAKEIAEKEKKQYIIIDGPPGIGCPVIAAITGVDLALIVTEPTLSGIHDMKRIGEVTKHFGIATKVVINKYDLNLKNTETIRQICEKEGMEVIALLPFCREVSESIVHGIPFVEFSKNALAQKLTLLWEKVK